MRLITSVLIVFCCSAAAAAELTDIRWDARGRYAHEAAIAPGQFAEVCGKLAAKKHVRWQFRASSAIDFNLHYHLDKTVVYPSKRAATQRAKGVLITPLDPTYC